MTNSRDEILQKIKRNKPAPRRLPEIPTFAIPGKPIQNFVSHLVGFDGVPQMFATRNDAIIWLNKYIQQEGKKVFSVIDGYSGNVKLADYPTSAAMHDIDVCVGEALMGVGETGSLLVNTTSLGDPAAALFSTDLYLLIDRNLLVDGMQDAYSKIDLSNMQYSSFFTGPSATADIEAVHITGAQGEISLTALIYNCSDEDIEDAKAIMSLLPKGTPLGQPDAPELKLRRKTDLAAGSDSV